MRNEDAIVHDLVGISLEEIEKMSAQEPKTLVQRYLKLGEEVGELAQELGIAEGFSGFKYKEEGKDGIKGECVDILQVALSIFFSAGGTKAQLHEILSKKNKKWKDKMESA